MEQLIAHLIGDYWLQTDRQALGKKENFGLALQHAATYILPFLLITQSSLALLVICLSHAIIDHIKFGEYIDNIINYFNSNKSDRPVWLIVWINIIRDNTAHLLINYLAIMYL